MNPKNQEAPIPNQLHHLQLAGPPFAKSNGGQWSTGLCDCFDDPSNCLITCFCPCITVGQIVEIVDRGTTSCLVGGLIYYAWALLGVDGYTLAQTAPNCEGSSHYQKLQYRELKNRGADPSIGWQGNVEKWNREGLTPPIVAPGMAR
ncbi:hypothetical protein SLA2020_280170 [Shorea laevis]